MQSFSEDQFLPLVLMPYSPVWHALSCVSAVGRQQAERTETALSGPKELEITVYCPCSGNRQWGFLYIGYFAKGQLILSPCLFQQEPQALDTSPS